MLKTKKQKWTAIGLCYATLLCFMAAGSEINTSNSIEVNPSRTSRLDNCNQQGGRHGQPVSGPTGLSSTEQARQVALILQEHLFSQQASKNKLIVWTMQGCPYCVDQHRIADALKRAGYAVEYTQYEENRELARKFGIRRFPTCQVYTNGKLVKTFVGLTSADELKKYLKLNEPDDYNVW